MDRQTTIPKPEEWLATKPEQLDAACLLRLSKDNPVAFWALLDELLPTQRT